MGKKQKKGLGYEDLPVPLQQDIRFVLYRLYCGSKRKVERRIGKLLPRGFGKWHRFLFYKSKEADFAEKRITFDDLEKLKRKWRKVVFKNF